MKRLTAMMSLSVMACQSQPFEEPRNIDFTDPRSTEVLELGRKGYQSQCAICHGDSGDGQGPAGRHLTPPAANLIKDDYRHGDSPEELFHTLTYGIPGTPMTSFQFLSEDVRWAITHYTLSLREGAESQP